MLKQIKIVLLATTMFASHKSYAKAQLQFINEDYLISDPEYAVILHEECVQHAPTYDLTYRGVFCRPITDNPDDYAMQDLKGYAFDEYISNHDDQRYAAACSSLNILARQLDQEVTLFENAKQNR